MKRLHVFALGALMASSNATAQTLVHEKYYNEAFESESGIDGEVHVLTPAGKAKSLTYAMDTYGTFSVYDEQSGQGFINGQVYEDGTVLTTKAGSPKPPKPPRPIVGRTVRGTGWVGAVCAAVDQVTYARCELQCRGTSIKTYKGGYCGVNTECTCQTPPPPPPNPIPTPSLGWNFTPPWQTVVNWNTFIHDPGIEQSEP